MLLGISFETLSEYNGKDLIPLICKQCSTVFNRQKTRIITEINRKTTAYSFCSRECQRLSQLTGEMLNCGYCHILIYKKRKEILKSKSGNSYCSRSCSVKYNNTHKTHGYRKSKLEIHLEQKIRETYPNLKLICNDVSTINYELDFYFPDLKFAIELNGIFHYEPIYGNGKLERIQFNDKQKILLCYEKGIELCVLDIAHIKHLSIPKKEEMWLIVKNILDSILTRTNPPPR